MVAARLTFPDVMHRLKVLHLIDNTVALSKSVHGYANEPDMAAVVNSLHRRVRRRVRRRGVVRVGPFSSRTRRPCSRARARSPMAWLPTGSAVTFSSLRLDRWTSVMHDGQPPHSNAWPLRSGARLYRGISPAGWTASLSRRDRDASPLEPLCPNLFGA